MRAIFRWMIVPMFCAALLAGCGDEQPDADDMQSDTTATSEPAGPIEIVRAEPGPEFPDARLVVVSPGPDEVVSGDSVMVSVNLQGVDLKTPTENEMSKGIAFSNDGQHIHVIIDNEPYMAMYTTDSFSVGPLAPGVHALRAFPSRSWHESIKVPEAFVSHNFYVGEKSDSTILTEGEPLLTYSRPKGTYEGPDAEKVLLDFYLSNAELSPDGYKVVVSVSGNVIDTLTEWAPYYIQNLPSGDHSIRLELVGPDGAVVPGVFNTTERTITVRRGGIAERPSHSVRYEQTAGPAKP